MIPAHARIRHLLVEERRQKLLEYAESFTENRIEPGRSGLGIITSGIGYHYAREVFPDSSIFKLAMTYPLPLQKLHEFSAQVKETMIIEELEPYLEEQAAAAGIRVTGKQKLPRTGEYSPQLLREKLLSVSSTVESDPQLPPRPPVLCPGCPHRPVFHILKKIHATISGDIGCYTLSALPPLNSIDTCVCMGASIGLAQGLVRSLDEKRKERVVSVLGDSTFIHAGLPGLVNAVYNAANITIVVLDNRITAMTGHQDNPGSGKTLMGKEVHPFDFEGMARAAGVHYIRTVDPIVVDELEKVLSEAIAFSGPAVVITRRPCVLLERDSFQGPLHIDLDLCKTCRLCLMIGCPALSYDQKTIAIDPELCVGCSLCQQICPEQAIGR